MKKIYILATLLVAFTFSSNAQIAMDDIESYPVGPVHQDHWTSWSGNPGVEDGIVTTDVAASGSQSIGIYEGSTQDCVLDLGNKTTGMWYLDFNMYVDSGSTGYFNMQNVVGAGQTGTEFNFHVQFNEGSTNPGGATIYLADGASQGQGTVIGSFSYSEATWFHISLVIDLGAGVFDFIVDGNPVFVGTSYYTNGASIGIGGIDFFSVDANNRYYIDDVRFDETALGTNDFSTDAFSVYPNPVQDILNIKSTATVDAVTVYDILGKVVLQEQPAKVSPSIDMSGLTSGAYLVKVTIGNASKTVKVLK